MAKSTQASTAPAVDLIDQIRKRAHEIENRACDIRTLVKAIFDKLDEMGNMDEAQMEAHNAINCFANCILQNATVLDDQYTDLLLLTSSTSSPAGSEKGGA